MDIRCLPVWLSLNYYIDFEKKMKDNSVKYEKYVSVNRDRNRRIYPWCYGIVNDTISIYGVCRRKEEAISKVKEYFDSL